MEILGSDLSTSSAASERMHSKEEADRIADGNADDHAAAQNIDVELGIEEKKSFKFKFTVFMLCFVSVVVAMVGPPIGGESCFKPFSPTKVCRTRSSWLRLYPRL